MQRQISDLHWYVRGQPAGECSFLAVLYYSSSLPALTSICRGCKLFSLQPFWLSQTRWSNHTEEFSGIQIVSYWLVYFLCYHYIHFISEICSHGVSIKVYELAWWMDCKRLKVKEMCSVSISCVEVEWRQVSLWCYAYELAHAHAILTDTDVRAQSTIKSVWIQT